MGYERKEDRSGMYAITHIQTRQRDIIRLHSLGLKNIQIAKKLGVSETNVSQVITSPLAQAEINKINKVKDEHTMDYKAHIESCIPKALDVLEDIIDNNLDGVSPSLRLKASEDILNMANIGPAKSSSVTNNTVIFNDEKIAEIKKRALQSGEAVQTRIIDVEVEDDNVN